MRPIIILSLACLVAGCNPGNKERERENGGTGERARQRSAQPVARKALYPQEDVLSILRELNAGEIVTARLAREVSQNDEVLGYAAVIAKDHSDLMLMVDSMQLQARDNLISGTLKRSADSVVNALRNLPAGFNNSFIDAQVRMHQQALLLLDTAIVPSVKDAKLKQLLLDVRPTLAAHLQRAMQLYSERKKIADERGEEFIPAPKPIPPRPVEPTPSPITRPDTVPATTTQM